MPSGPASRPQVSLAATSSSRICEAPLAHQQSRIVSMLHHRISGGLTRSPAIQALPR